MTKPRIFISHSAKSDRAKALLRELSQSLLDAGYPVLLDQEALTLGDNWRDTLNLWIGGCDAALVLLSEHALQSPFVAYETSILTYRQRSDPNFRLFPIFTDLVDYDAVENSLLSPSRIHDIQSLIKETSSNKIIECIRIELAKAEQKRTPIDRPIEQLCDLLAEVPEHVLQEEAKSLGINLGRWIPSSELKRILAAKMLGAGLEKSKKAIRALRSYLPEPRRQSLREIIDLVGSSWVDYRSVIRIPETAKEHRTLCINGERPLTARLYVVRACKYPPRDCWLVAEADGIMGEEVKADLKEDIEQSLCQVLKANDVTELQEALNEYANVEEPVFVALPSNGIDVHLIQGLKKDFPTVTFFLLAGFEIFDQALLNSDDVEFLRPELEPGSERYYCTQYENKLSYLMRALK